MLFSGLKVLETRTHRDAAAAAFLGYFLIITNFLYTQSIPTALAMAVALFAITATLIGFSAPNRAARANLRTAALLLAHGCQRRRRGPCSFRVQDRCGACRKIPLGAHRPLEMMAPAESRARAVRHDFRGIRGHAAVPSQVPPARRSWDFDGRT
jgi:hypothetical protein